MRQTLHLLVVDRRRRAALIGAVASKWLLPVLTSGERVRAGPTVLRWMNELGIAGEIIGQWLGRITPDCTDWLLVISAAPQTAVRNGELTWMPFERLSPATALLDYQAWAVAASLVTGGNPSRPGPFGAFDWLEDVRAWIAASLGSTPTAFAPYRVTAYEVVLGADTRHGRVYFKGLTEQRASEPRVTQALAALAPSSFAPTFAFDRRPDGSFWWLTAGCPGTAGTCAGVIASALGRLQQRVMASAPTLRALPLVDLWVAERWATELVADADCAAAIEQSLQRVASGVAADTWIPMDLDRVNVLVDGSDVRFIDLDDSFLGPAPLAMAVFARRCRARSLYQIYERSWSPRLARVDWPSFEIAAMVVETWRGWQRVKRNIERGELHGALDLVIVRTRERLVRDLRALVADGRHAVSANRSRS